MKAVFREVLTSVGLQEARAELSARLFAEASLDGVASHGLNRFPSYVDAIRKGYAKADVEPEKVGGIGMLEQWDGKQGVGNLNAYRCMERAIELARAHGIGCVALRNTNHWMRGGSYGWQAADAGCLGICFTNTTVNMAPWGGRTSTIGNNPLVFAVPRKKGHVVLDMAMSQFSYGRLAMQKSLGKPLPVPGGYNSRGELTADPAEIFSEGRILPMGYWKGSGLSVLMDLFATLLSSGWPTKHVKGFWNDQGVSQLFLCFDGRETDESLAEEIIEFTCSSEPLEAGGRVYYPGERTLLRRRENLEKGIPVDPAIWRKVREMVPSRG